MLALESRVQNRVSDLQRTFGYKDVATEARATWAVSRVALIVCSESQRSCGRGDAAATPGTTGATGRLPLIVVLPMASVPSFEDTSTYAAALKGVVAVLPVMVLFEMSIVPPL